MLRSIPLKFNQFWLQSTTRFSKKLPFRRTQAYNLTKGKSLILIKNARKQLQLHSVSKMKLTFDRETPISVFLNKRLHSANYKFINIGFNICKADTWKKGIKGNTVSFQRQYYFECRDLEVLKIEKDFNRINSSVSNNCRFSVLEFI